MKNPRLIKAALQAIIDDLKQQRSTVPTIDDLLASVIDLAELIEDIVTESKP
jgi:hypothetical protein